MYHQCEPPVIHRDFNEGNIFMDFPDNSSSPDFYIGDFGFSEIYEPGPDKFIDYEGMDKTGAITLLAQHVDFAMNGADSELDLGQRMDRSIDTAEHVQILDGAKIMLDQFFTLTSDEQAKFPDLSPIIALVSSAPPPNGDEAALASFREMFAPANLSEEPVPRLETSALAALNIRALHGPWYVAKVDISGGLTRPNVLEVDTTARHHRPNYLNDDSDTDSDEQSLSRTPSPAGPHSLGSDDDSETEYRNVNRGISPVRGVAYSIYKALPRAYT